MAARVLTRRVPWRGGFGRGQGGHGGTAPTVRDWRFPVVAAAPRGHPGGHGEAGQLAVFAQSRMHALGQWYLNTAGKCDNLVN